MYLHQPAMLPLRQRRIMVLDSRVIQRFTDGGPWADPHSAVLHSDSIQSRNPVNVDQKLRSQTLHLDLDDQVRAAGQHPGPVAMLAQQRQYFVETSGGEVFEWSRLQRS